MKITLFKPHAGQRKIIDGFADSEHKFGVVSTGRQFGKSLLAQNLALYWCLKNPKTKCGWVTPIYRQGEKVFEEMHNACRQIVRGVNKSQLKMNFINGSQIQFLSADNPDTIRGYSFDWMVIDEAAFIAERAINEAIIPTLTARGKKCLVISTPRSKNWFYSWFLKGQEQSSDYISFEGISADNPYTDKGFIEEQRLSLPDEIFKQEYLAKFSESTNDVFRNLDLITILEEWNEPTRGTHYYFGVDVGLSNDYTVCTILTEGGDTANILRFNGSTIEHAGKLVVHLLKRYNPKGGYVEVNGIGQALFELIRKDGVRVKAFTTNNENKTLGIRKLINDMEVGNILLPSKNLLKECYNEFAAFSYKMNANGTLTFSAPNGQHDDIVMSYMLANLARNEIFSNKSLYIGQHSHLR